MQTWWSSAEQQREIEAVGRENMWRLGQNYLEGTSWSREGCSSISTVVASSRESWSVVGTFWEEIKKFGVLGSFGPVAIDSAGRHNHYISEGK